MRRVGADPVSEAFVALVDHPAGRQVLVRRVRPALGAALPDLAARVDELRAVHHPGVAAVLEFVASEGELFVVEEWIEGTSVGALIRRNVPVPPEVLLYLACEMCTSLDALHGAGRFHGAFHPDAIRITPDARVVIGRYGLAPYPTVISATTHSVEYLAPEQTRPEVPLTPAVDVFSLAAVLYELVVLRPLFRAETSLQTLHKIRQAEVSTALIDVHPRIAGLDRVLYRSLSLNPRHRYQRAQVVLEDLRALIAGLGPPLESGAVEERARALLASVAELGDGTPDLGPDEADSTASLIADLRRTEAGSRTRRTNPPETPTAHAADAIAGGMRTRTPPRPQLTRDTLLPSTGSSEIVPPGGRAPVVPEHDSEGVPPAVATGLTIGVAVMILCAAAVALAAWWLAASSLLRE